LSVHLFFAVSTAILWIVVPLAAWIRFPRPPRPSAHSTWHRRLGWMAAIGLVCTAITGWAFYGLAFVA
jgi:hypothetical protein